MQWDICMQYGRHIWSGSYVINVKCMYNHASGHIIDDIEFIWGIYVAYLMVLEEHICCWHIYVYSMENKICGLMFFFILCAVNVGPTCRLFYLVTWPKKSCCISFQLSDSRNAMVSLMKMLASCYVNVKTNGVTCPQKLCWTSFQLSWSKECNDAIDNTVGIVWHQHWWQWCQWPKMSCCTSFDCHWSEVICTSFWLSLIWRMQWCH